MDRQVLPESAWSRAYRDTSAIVSSLRFVLATTVLAVAVGAVAAIAVASDARNAVKLLGGALSAGATTLVVLALCFCWQLIRAPIRQRNEAWAALGMGDTVVPSELAIEFSQFVKVIEATRPKQRFSPMSLFDLSRADRAREQSAWNQADDQARRAALAQYHERFQAQVLKLLSQEVPVEFAKAHRDKATAPRGFSDLYELDDALARLAGGPQKVLEQRISEADKLRASVGSPHLANWLSDYDSWREDTLSILAEWRTGWAEVFSSVGAVDRHDPRLSEADLQDQLDRDVASLRRFSQELVLTPSVQ